jgi:hypothetical protein
VKHDANFGSSVDVLLMSIVLAAMLRSEKWSRESRRVIYSYRLSVLGSHGVRFNRASNLCFVKRWKICGECVDFRNIRPVVLGGGIKKLVVRDTGAMVCEGSELLRIASRE